MPDRIILINKPYHWTSFDVVKKLRKPLLEEKRRDPLHLHGSEIKKLKVGHAGTLDPLATGLLVLCSGKLTQQISIIQDAEKEYTGTLVLGSITNSYDLETTPQHFSTIDFITDEKVNKEATSFIGYQMQKPPLYSAIKVDGKRAYEKARRGEDFELKERGITIKLFEIISIKLPEVDFRIICSKGTYIRTLVHDFGQRLLTGAYLSALCRTRIGDYHLRDACSPDQFLSQLVEKQNNQ